MRKLQRLNLKEGVIGPLHSLPLFITSRLSLLPYPFLNCLPITMPFYKDIWTFYTVCFSRSWNTPAFLIPRSSLSFPTECSQTAWIAGEAHILRVSEPHMFKRTGAHALAKTTDHIACFYAEKAVTRSSKTWNV